MAFIHSKVVGLLMTMVVSDVAGQMRAHDCTKVQNDTDHANKRPHIPDTFKVHVECNMYERHKSVSVTEYYDQPLNRGRLTIHSMSGKKDYYMDYDKNVLLEVDSQTNGCQSGQLQKSGDSFIFGYKLGSGYSSHMFSPSGALYFSNTNESYGGTDVVRGILVDKWYSCQFLSSINASAMVVWHFSQNSSWTMGSDEGHVTPVRLTVEGEQVLPNSTVQHFRHLYEFYQFESHVDPLEFEVGSGVYCPDAGIAATSKPFPAFPDSFTFVGEINDPSSDSFTIIEEAYDKTSKLTLYNYKQASSSTTLRGMNQMTTLNDYNTGVSYLVDHTMGSCQYLPITDSAVAFTIMIDNHQVRMKTPREFFMDSNINYQYLGVETTRNIQCDRWVAVTDQVTGYDGINVTVEWYFAAADVETWNGAAQFSVPVLFRLFTSGQAASSSYEYSIFFFTTKFYLPEVDISQCFTGVQRKPVRFSIPKTSETEVRANTLETTVAIQNAVALFTGISALRVDNVQFYFNAGDVVVTFDLLDSPPRYQDVNASLAQNSLGAAYGLLGDAFSGRSISFSVVNSDNSVVQVSPDYSSLQDLTVTSTTSPNQNPSSTPYGNPKTVAPPQPSGSSNTVTPAQTTGDSQQQQPDNDDNSMYSGGALAGLGVAMLLIGGAGGAVGGRFFFK